MDQATYDQAAEKIRAGRVAEVNGRSALSLEELDWIRAVEEARPAPQPETNIQQAAARHAAAMEQRVRDAEAGLPPPGFPPSMPDALAVDENPVETVEGLARTPPVNPGQAEAARETGAGPVVEGAPPSTTGQEPAATSETAEANSAPDANTEPVATSPGPGVVVLPPPDAKGERKGR